MADIFGAVMPIPPGRPIEIVFSFDRTGSMGAYIEKVSTKVSAIIARLLGDIPFLRIAIFAHGDYCDYSKYVTKHVDFTRDVDELCDFVNDVEGTMGGDWEECYELVLQEVRTKLSWQPGSQRALVMIGDSIPHNVDYYKRHGRYTAGSRVIDWKEETRRLHDETGVHVYGVQCGAEKSANFFWEYLAEATGGKRLELDDFGGIVELVMAICYRESGHELYMAYEREVRELEGAALRRDLDTMFTHLRDPTGSTIPAPGDTTSTPTLSRRDTGNSSISRFIRNRKRMRPIIESDDDDDDDDTTCVPGPSLSRVDSGTSSVLSKADSTFSSASKIPRLFDSSSSSDDDDGDGDGDHADRWSYSSDADTNSSYDTLSTFSGVSGGITIMDIDDSDDESHDPCYCPDMLVAEKRDHECEREREEATVRRDVDKMFTDLRNTTTNLPSEKSAEVPAGNNVQATVKAPANTVGKNSGKAAAKTSLVSKKSIKAPSKKVAKKRVKAPVTTKSKILTKDAISLDDFLELNELPPLHRESKTSVKLALPDLYWSRWQFAMGTESAVHGVKGHWCPRRAGHKGMRNTSLFKEWQEQPAIYEFAVQLSKSPMKHTVLLRSTGGFENMCWDTYLLRDSKVRRKIDNILTLGHKLYVRRAVLTLPYTTVVRGNKVKLQDANEVRQLLCAVYDYPWKRRRLENDHRGSRLVKRSGVVISGN